MANDKKRKKLNEKKRLNVKKEVEKTRLNLHSYNERSCS